MQRTLKEQFIIDKAKQIMMESKEMSEPEAYRYIQKSSMDAGRSILESARMIILLHQK